MKCKVNYFLFPFVVLVSLTLMEKVSAQQELQDWTTWRGPNLNGVVDDQKPVTAWSETENVIWRAKVPGRGHGSPIICGGKIFLPTSDVGSQTQSVLCYDQATGEQLWNKQVNEGEFAKKIYPKNTHASSTVACDGERIFALFNNHGQHQVTCLNFDGNVLWQKFIATYKTGFGFGSGASPITYKDKVIIVNDAKSECAIVVLNGKTGEETSRIERGNFSSYSTPVIAEIGGKTQMLISGGKTVKSYDPDSGKENWSVPASWAVTCGTMVWDGDMVFASGGYPTQQTIAINAKDGTKVWDNSTKFYEQSMVVFDGRLYGLSNRGVVFCWDAKSGEEHFKTRFEEPVSASPIVANGNIYFTAESGNTLVIKAGTDKFEEVAKNKLGDLAFASFAVANDKIFTRVGEKLDDQDVQEWLYCLGTE